MLNAPPDLNRLRTITDQALHGHTALGIHHPPQTHVTIAAAHLDVLLRTVDPDQLGHATSAHNRATNRAAAHARCIESITAAIASLETAIAKNDTATATAASRNLTRLARQLQETAAR